MPVVRSAVCAVLVLLLLAGCAPERDQPVNLFANQFDPPAATPQSRAAERALKELEDEIALSRTLEPAAAFAKQQKLEPHIDATVDRCAGTRFENKAVYLQAQWRIQFNDDGKGVDQSLDRLDGLSQPVLKLSGKALRVQHLLRQERIVTARSRAEPIAAEVPAFSYLLDLVRWHERTGGIVEGTAGPGLDGQPVDPTTATERFLLYLHFAVWDDQAEFTTSRYLNAIGNADCRLVLVIRDGSPKRITDDLAKLAGHDKCTVLLCRSKAEAQAVFTAWTPPLDPWTVLLDGKRRIVKVEVRPGDVSELIR